MAINPEGGGVKALMARQLREELLFGFPNKTIKYPFHKAVPTRRMPSLLDRETFTLLNLSDSPSEDVQDLDLVQPTRKQTKRKVVEV